MGCLALHCEVIVPPRGIRVTLQQLACKCGPAAKQKWIASRGCPIIMNPLPLLFPFFNHVTSIFFFNWDYVSDSLQQIFWAIVNQQNSCCCFFNFVLSPHLLSAQFLQFNKCPLFSWEKMSFVGQKTNLIQWNSDICWWLKEQLSSLHLVEVLIISAEDSGVATITEFHLSAFERCWESVWTTQHFIVKWSELIIAELVHLNNSCIVMTS